MAARGGAEFIIKYNTGTVQTPVWAELAGGRSREFKINNEPIDVSSASSASKWRELITGQNIKSIDISMDGIFHDTTAHTALKTAALGGTTMNLQITVPGDGAYVGAFAVSGYGLSAPHDDVLKFSCSLMSTGVVTFTSV